MLAICALRLALCDAEYEKKQLMLVREEGVQGWQGSSYAEMPDATLGLSKSARLLSIVKRPISARTIGPLVHVVRCTAKMPPSKTGIDERLNVISQVQSPSGTAWAFIAKITGVVTRRCFDRTSDAIEMLMSAFLVISAIALSSALWRKFAQTGKGASWTNFPYRLTYDKSRGVNSGSGRAGCGLH